MTPELLELVKKEADRQYPRAIFDYEHRVGFEYGASFMHGLMEKEVEMLKGLLREVVAGNGEGQYNIYKWEEFCKDNNL